ncbi:MAG: TonB-dependent receptor [Bacteroidetes bacterium]|nr:TonB-dependent receptor [Bacteroidota bacterium]
MKKNIILLSCLIWAGYGKAQNHNDSISTQGIQEVILIKSNTLAKKEAKPLGSIDEYLQKSNQVDMIRRGAYAWEPIINNMTTERTLVTIDGMRIFGACTDKMDPITSYVEVSNLSSAKITSGQQGSCHGTTIGGAINLERNKNSFGEQKWKVYLNTGFESVNQQKIWGGSLQFKNKQWYNDTNFMFRDAHNYKAGGGIEIPYSQYKKMNLSQTLGYKLNDNNLVEASVIYDKATHVGYPALPMDVSLAEAIIGSVQHKYNNKEGKLQSWETKIYYNNITHRMDDTQRPAVPIHMDMPGWSTTYGYYSKANANWGKHQILGNISGFFNRSLADMTMYPNQSSEKLMYMLTWPDVHTLNQALYLEDTFTINDNSNLKANVSFTFHQNKVNNTMGIESLQIFYPEMKEQKSRGLKSIAVQYNHQFKNIETGFGMGYGERAPSVSEGYGFYLFNSMEKYDYIGNPYLKNEESLEGNLYVRWKNQSVSLQLNASYFNIRNYIVGEVIPGLVPMTIGGLGVKKTTALDRVYILNIGLNSEIKINPHFKWIGQISYNDGRDKQQQILPYISPLRYRTSLSYHQQSISSELSLTGNAAKNKFNPKYGESNTADYAIIGFNIGYQFLWKAQKLDIKTGVENILDTNYTTFSDWNKIPRPGRNFFINLNYSY